MTQKQYFSGLTLRLRPVDFTVLSQEDVLLLLEWDGRSLCLIASDGSVRYRQEDMEALLPPS